MHRLVTTGYGQPALDALSDRVATVKSDDPMAPVTLLLPNNIAGIVARRHLATGQSAQRPAVAGIHLATLPRLAEQLAAARLHPRRPATSSIVSAAWRSALVAAPGPFEPVMDHPATIRALVSSYRELRDLSDGALADVAAGSSLAGEVVRLHRQVVATLQPDWYDTTDLLHAAAALAPDHAHERGELILYLPQRLSQAESRFARALAAQSDLTVIAAITSVQRADRTIIGSLSRIEIPQPSARRQRPTAGRILHASDSDEEVRCVVREIVSALQETPAHRIAVMYSAAVPYARLLHEQLDAAGIAFNGPGVRAVPERAIARSFLAILALIDQDVRRSDLFQALADAPVRFGAGRVPVTRWERLSRLAGIVSADDWRTRSDRLVQDTAVLLQTEREQEDPNESRIAGFEKDIEATKTMRDFVAGLHARLAEGAVLSTWSALGAWALNLFHDLYGESEAMSAMPPEEQYAAAALERSLTGLAILDDLEPVSDLPRLREVVALDLEAALPRVGKFGEGVFVGPVSASIGLSVDLAFVLGLAEDIYPGRLHQDALLPERVRDATTELAASRDSLDAKQRHLLAAFAVAPTVVASFPRGDLRKSTGRLPSQFVLPTLRHLTGNHELAASEWNVECEHIVGSASYAEGIATAEPATEQEWRIRAAAAQVDLDDAVVTSARDLLDARASGSFTRYDGNLSGSDGLPDFATSGQAVSPTSLEAYADCPHRYLMEKMLKIRPLEQPEALISISAIDIGNLVHQSMDEFIRECAGDLPSYGAPWSAQQRQRLHVIAGRIADDFQARGLTGHAVLWERDKAALLAVLAGMLAEDDRQRAEDDARVVRSELPFGLRGAPPVRIDLPDGRRILMRGSADKVDETRGGVLQVTDFKTGSPKSYEKLESTKTRPADPVVGGTKLQLPVYAYAARQLLGGDQVEAAYWFVLRENKRIAVPLDDSVADLYARTVGTLVSSMADGHFPAKAPAQPDFAWVQCPYCNPDGVGHGDVRARWERKRADPALQALVELVDPEAGSSP